MAGLARNGEMRTRQREFTPVVAGDRERRDAEAFHRVAVGAILHDVPDREVSLVKVLVTVCAEGMFRFRIEVGAVAIPARNARVFPAEGIPGQVVVERMRVDKRERYCGMTPFTSLPEPSPVDVPVAGNAVHEFHPRKLYERFVVSDLAGVAFFTFDFPVCPCQREGSRVVLKFHRRFETCLVVA